MDMLSKVIKKELDGIIDYICNKDEYKKCLELKEKMKNNTRINALIKEIKKLQKESVREGKKNKKLKELEQELNSIPIYVEYNNNLKVVNEMLNYVNESLNDYFYKKLNEEITNN